MHADDIEAAKATVSLVNAVRRSFLVMGAEKTEAHVKATLAIEATKLLARRSRKPKAENGKAELFGKEPTKGPYGVGA